ncbi:uncharacterized protein LOC106081996 [Stomoxys calcitrans]|uniref:uncharacterized protein LOC106081996 n=1 Tax=Stomoxys calcitrans TaxID=35570 RepID=UPI0027E341DA|nr:uncharacterized protein LOC106081996 [Stomoxys calcitrans]
MAEITTTDSSALLNRYVRNFNTLLQCPARFAGGKDGQNVQQFIEHIKYYKSLKCVTDEQALQELHHLLKEPAATWWLQKKQNCTSWSEALKTLEKQYSKSRSAHMIWKDLFRLPYQAYGTVDEFLNEKSGLLNELPEPHLNEQNKLAIISGLLPSNMQTSNTLSNISTIEELKEYVLRYKQKHSAAIPLLKEVKMEPVDTEGTDINTNTQNGGKTVSEHANYFNNNLQITSDKGDSHNDNPSNMSKQIVRCKFCRRKGHIWQLCNMLSSQKLQAMDELCNPSILQELQEYLQKYRNSTTVNDNIPVAEKDNIEKITTTNLKTQFCESIANVEEDRSNTLTKIENSTISEMVDSDIMEQINRIIEESEKYCPTIENNLQISSVKSVADIYSAHSNTRELQVNNSKLLISSVMSKVEMNTSEKSLDVNALTEMSSTLPQVQDQPIQKKKIRCTFCRKNGHLWETCFKIPMQIANLLNEIKSAEGTVGADE